MQSARMGLVNYSSCLTVYVSKDGLYLSVWPMFRLGHPPLFLPWSAIQKPTLKKVLWVEMASFEVGVPRLASVTLSKKVLEAAKAYV